MLLSETKLKDSHVIHLRGFNFHRMNKTADYMTGTGILIRETIKHETINTTNWNLQVLEVSAVLVHTTQQPI